MVDEITLKFQQTKHKHGVSYRSKCKVAFAENLLLECLKQQERFRKMLVNNKQQRKTMHYRNRLIIRDIRATVSCDGIICIERLMQMDAALKQHHRTVARKILEEVNIIINAIHEHVHAYQKAVDNL